MGIDSIEHMLLAIENTLALREHCVNYVYLCMIVIHYKNR